MPAHHTNDGAIHLSVDYDDRHDPLKGFPAPPAWTVDAICARTDPDLFFPEKGGSSRDAKRICSGCPVQVECLDYALGNCERYGIWGGVSERGRRRLLDQPIRHVDEIDDDLDTQLEPA